jgi:DNA invertase Pin-like site-specific DNA recombinase
VAPRQRKPAAIYARLSVEREADEDTSLGIARQVKLCKQRAAERGFTVADEHVYREPNISAYNGKRRKEFERLSSAIAHDEVRVVLAVDQDRLSRSMPDWVAFLKLCEEHRVSIVLLSGEIDTATADGELVLHIQGVVAHNASRKASERLKRQREQAAANGWYQGGPRPYGYRLAPKLANGRRIYKTDGKVINTLSVEPKEAKVIKECTRRLLDDGHTVRSIVCDLNDDNVPSVRGGKWHASQFVAMITSHRLAGKRVHRGNGDEIVTDADWDAILTMDEHERLRALLIDSRSTGRGRPTRSLLSGLATCAKCGARLNQGRTCSRRGSRRVYRCSSSASSCTT